MSAPTLLVQPLTQGLRAVQPFQLDLLVRVQAPDAPADAATPRAPLHLALVLDRSGSMSGKPLQEAKRCAVAIMERLEAQDRIALVTYDNRADTVLPLAEVGDREAFRQAVSRIHSGGCTNLHLGWSTGLQQLQADHRPEVLSRVLLLSDGQANDGLQDPQALAEEARRGLGQGIGTSTYGLGHQFQEGLMTAMARAGQGRAYYGEQASDLMDPFMEEFDLLSNLFARRLVLALQVPPGVRVTQLNKYSSPAPGAWELPELGYAAEAWAVFRLEGDPAGLAAWAQDGALALAHVALTYVDLKGHPGSVPAQPLALPLLGAEAFAGLALDPLVRRRVGELRAADLQERAYRACLEGDWDQVHRLLDELRELAKDNPWTEATFKELESLASRREAASFAKETYYQSITWSARLADKDEDISPHMESFTAYTRRKKRQGKGEQPEA